MTTFNYHAPGQQADLDRRVTNLGAIRNPHGKNARWLKVMDGQGDSLIAVSWHRVQPKRLPKGYHLIQFF